VLKQLQNLLQLNVLGVRGDGPGALALEELQDLVQGGALLRNFLGARRACGGTLALFRFLRYGTARSKPRALNFSDDRRNRMERIEREGHDLEQEPLLIQPMS
jgi:hypothetical protein